MITPNSVNALDKFLLWGSLTRAWLFNLLKRYHLALSFKCPLLTSKVVDNPPSWIAMFLGAPFWPWKLPSLSLAVPLKVESIMFSSTTKPHFLQDFSERTVSKKNSVDPQTGQVTTWTSLSSKLDLLRLVCFLKRLEYSFSPSSFLKLVLLSDTLFLIIDSFTLIFLPLIM